MAEDEHQGHIPKRIHRGCVEIVPVAVYTGAVPTIFLGCISEGYQLPQWKNNVARVQHLFGVANELVHELQVPLEHENDSVHKFSEKVKIAVDLLNSQSFSHLRIARLGSKHSTLLEATLLKLVQGWNSKNKIIQLVSLGDTGDRKWLNIARSLCLYGICNGVQLYNTMDYDNNGEIPIDDFNALAVALR